MASLMRIVGAARPIARPAAPMRRFGGGVADNGGGSGLAVRIGCSFLLALSWSSGRGGSGRFLAGVASQALAHSAGARAASRRRPQPQAARRAVFRPGFGPRRVALTLCVLCRSFAAAPAAGAQLAGSEGGVDHDVVLDHVPRLPRPAPHAGAHPIRRLRLTRPRPGAPSARGPGPLRPDHAPQPCSDLLLRRRVCAVPPPTVGGRRPPPGPDGRGRRLPC